MILRARSRPVSLKRRVLIADRDADSRRMYAEYLALSAWTVDEAGDGREALAKAIAHPPDVIVTETRLPGIDGYDLCALLRRDSSTRRVPIVVVTGDAFVNDVGRATTAGADLVLVKPCLPEALRAEMERLVDIGRRAAAHADAAAAATTARRFDRPRPAMSHALYRHDTTEPPLTPPPLACPHCGRALTYQRSHVGGVSARHPEQWDYFDCPDGCGVFQYRQRTLKLRRVV